MLHCKEEDGVRNADAEKDAGGPCPVSGRQESPERPRSGYMYPEIAAKLPKQTLLIEKIVEED